MNVRLYRAGKRQPVVHLAEVVPSEDEILMAIHEMALDLRRAVGEAPQSLAATPPPTTNSLEAYQIHVMIYWTAPGTGC